MGESKHTVVYIHQDALITGSAISLKNMIASLDPSQFNAIVITPKEGPAIKLWEDSGASVYIFPFTTFWTSPGPRCFSPNNIKQWAALFPDKKLRTFILQLNPSIIHINDKAALQAGISLKGCGIPIIQHSRSAFHLTKCSINKILSARFIRSYANHIICISEDEMQGFESFKAKTVLYNTVNMTNADAAMNEGPLVRQRLGIDDTQIVIGMAEQLGVNKGLMDVISLIDELLIKQQFNNVKFLLVGDISKTDSLQSVGIPKSSFQYVNDFLIEHKLTDKVLLTGFQSAPLDYIAAMDILIVSKAHGVLGRKPIEAQSVATAVVAINGHSKQSSIVQNGIGGYLVDDFKGLVTKIHELVLDSTHIEDLGKQGRTYAKKHFDLLTYGSKLESIYKQSLHCDKTL
jgi:glycosyltransferase involved in cell wall biosynthesis